MILLYPLVSYVLLPNEWFESEPQQLVLDAPLFTVNHSNVPDDPLNIGLIGTEADLLKAMTEAGWYKADDLSPLSRTDILLAILFHHRYSRAPVSKMYLWRRKQDFAFELPIGANPDTRHHVRFWRSTILTGSGIPLWIGTITLDRGIGFNHFTGQLTHHIAADTDTERELLIHDLAKTQQLSKIDEVRGTGAIIAKNAQGDFYETDGRIKIGLLTMRGENSSAPPATVMYPTSLDWRNKNWATLRSFLKQK